MEFDAKFFLVSLLLSAIAGIPQCLYTWLILDRIVSVEVYSWLSLITSPTGLVLGVLLPFVVMYLLSKTVTLQSMFRPVIISTFLGCWIGAAATGVANYAIILLSNGTTTSPLFIVWIALSIVADAFSLIFFVSLAAILFAHYRKTISQLPPERSVQPL